MIRLLRYLFWVWLGLTVVSCSGGPVREGGDKPYIVVTTGMLGDALRQIAGDQADVEALMGPGVDPHLYKASQRDLEKLLKADYIFYQGLHLEGKLGDVLKKLSRIRTVIAVGDGLPADRLLETHAGYPDPHVWFDVSLWKEVVRVAGHRLADADRLRAETYLRNTRRYMTELDSLHAWTLREIQRIPPRKRVLITAHDAFRYFGRAYDIEVRGLQGISTLAEFGLRDVTDLVSFITDREIPAIFPETSVSGRSVAAVIEGVEQRGGKLTLGNSLYSDAMGEPGTPEGTYIGMVTYNVSTLTRALAPETEKTMHSNR